MRERARCCRTIGLGAVGGARTGELETTSTDYARLVAGQRAYFKAGNTRPVSWRNEQLKAITAMIEANRDAIREALWHDLRRNETDADLMDIDINVHGAEFALRTCTTGSSRGGRRRRS